MRKPAARCRVPLFGHESAASKIPISRTTSGECVAPSSLSRASAPARPMPVLDTFETSRDVRYSVAIGQLLLLAAREHGRTIPLTDIRPLEPALKIRRAVFDVVRTAVERDLADHAGFDAAVRPRYGDELARVE